jgi:methylenetetrahydrofolate reductase (NADPH)
VLAQVGSLIGAGAQFLAVTKGAGGSLRGGSLPIAQTIKEQFKVPAIAHFTCRDLTSADVENQLMDHHYFGIRNILALRGDPPRGQEHWKPREGGYNYAHELIRQIRALNRGEYLAREGGPAADGSERTDFCIGAAVYPEHVDERERAEFFKIKVDAGAEYAMTQMIFDADKYARFLDLCARNGVKVPVLPGTRVLKSRKQAERLAKLFQVSVPAATLAALPEDDSPDGVKQGVELFLRYAERLKSVGAPGIHLYVIGDTDAACSAIRTLTDPLRTSAASKQEARL